MWDDPEIAAAWINGLFTLVSTVIGAATAAFVGQKIAERHELEEDLKRAKGDIEFLLAVEARHCEMHRLATDRSHKNSVRAQVKEKGFEWSGLFTPGRNRAADLGE